MITLECIGNDLQRIMVVLLGMTSLLAYKVAQPTKRIFLPKDMSQLVIFVVELAFTWSWVNKNLILKVNFLCQKPVMSEDSERVKCSIMSSFWRKYNMLYILHSFSGIHVAFKTWWEQACELGLFWSSKYLQDKFKWRRNNLWKN